MAKIIHKTSPPKSISKIKKVPLRELWRREDRNFTKWLEENIEYLNDALDIDLNILSREKNVGPFKVDLYAEASFGGNVIIENQLEKTNHEHLGKMLTYLTNLDAKMAIWIASKPVDEHIRAIQWLNEITPDDISFYLIKIEAIQISGCDVSAPLFTIVEGPTKESKQIGEAKKGDAQRHVFRKEFWSKFLEESNKKTSMCRNLSTSRDAWIGIALGIGGVSINDVISKKYARVEIFINRGSQEENKKVFDFFYKSKGQIEKDFGGKLVWERMDDKITSRIKYQLNNVNVSDKDDWDKMIKFMIDGNIRITEAFKNSVKKLRTELKK